MSVHELLDMVFRWAHLIAGIMWIGNSMLFNWLDRNLISPPADDAHRLSQGKIYMVHSGAFYEVEKKLLRPGELPDQLHWFKWQNGFTWMTGISLLVIVFFMNGAARLIGGGPMDLEPAAAIGISVGSLVAGWAIYDGLWSVLGKKAPTVANVLTLGLFFGAAYAFTLVFNGPAAYIQTGVLAGTIMTGNVWMRILPSQRSLIAATKEGKEQDAELSRRAKQRSIHNNYLTFPLLFIMLSQHFPATSGSHLRWYILAVIMVGGAGVRHFMNVRYAGRAWLWPALAMAAATLVGVMLLTRVKEAPAVVVKDTVPFARAQAIIVQRCMPCHSEHNTEPMFPQPPQGVLLDTPEHIKKMVPRIKYLATEIKTMPFLNRTKITDVERAELRSWIDAGAKLQ